MQELSGVISDRLRRMFTMKDKPMTYRRPSRDDSKPMPKDGSVEGIRLSPGRRKKRT